MRTLPATSYRLSLECRRLLRELATQHGVTVTAMIELMTRERARLGGLRPALAPQRDTQEESDDGPG